MTIKEQIEKDFLEAYKAHDELKVSVLRMLKSSIKNAEIALRQSSGSSDNKTELNDSDVIAVLKKEIKQRKDSIEAYKEAARVESVEQETKEMELLSSYLPSQMSEAELRSIAQETITQTGATGMQDMGKVIGSIMQKHGDSVDGGAVSKIVKELLSK